MLNPKLDVAGSSPVSRSKPLELSVAYAVRFPFESFFDAV